MTVSISHLKEVYASIDVDESMLIPPPNPSSYLSGMDEYVTMYKRSIENPERFWEEIALSNFFWEVKPSSEPSDLLSYNFNSDKGEIFIRWFAGARTNLCYNCLDRHVLNGLGERVAYFWEGNDSSDRIRLTYGELLEQVKRLATCMRNKLGLKRGDCVAIYMPMIPEIVIAVLACARIGAIHSVVFGGYSADSLAERIIDSNASTLLTCDGAWRGSKLLDLKSICNHSMDLCSERGHPVRHCVVVRHIASVPAAGSVSYADRWAAMLQLPLDASIIEVPGKRPVTRLSTQMLQNSKGERRDMWWHELLGEDDGSEEGDMDTDRVEWMDAEAPLFILYTSGSTGKPKGVLHTTAGYMVYAGTTFRMTFDYIPDVDIYWCTADVGWITGHSYCVYGPLCNAATSVMFEGIPTWPDPGRNWEIVDSYKVSVFYTAPTALRTLLSAGDEWVTRHSRASLRVLGSVGEPINPQVWLWYHRVVGEERCSIVDTFWQTETGGHMITPLAGVTNCKPGSATFPFFGVLPELIDQETNQLIPHDLPGEGYLVFSRPWPGIMRSVFGNHSRFETTYFHKFSGYYCTGDAARRDLDGFLWITGRIDDMMNVSGHLLSTAEIESALVTHPAVAEAAAVSRPHILKGECAYCFVTFKEANSNGNDATKNNCLAKNSASTRLTPALFSELVAVVRDKIGPFAAPDFIQEAPALPKTRSGKIMRRILRQIAVNDRHNMGDTSTLVDGEAVIEQLFVLRPSHA